MQSNVFNLPAVAKEQYAGHRKLHPQGQGVRGGVQFQKPLAIGTFQAARKGKKAQHGQPKAGKLENTGAL
jgi:hypothetical protein